jgi:hypothetical protein
MVVTIGSSSSRFSASCESGFVFGWAAAAWVSASRALTGAVTGAVAGAGFIAGGLDAAGFAGAGEGDGAFFASATTVGAWLWTSCWATGRNGSGSGFVASTG